MTGGLTTLSRRPSGIDAVVKLADAREGICPVLIPRVETGED